MKRSFLVLVFVLSNLTSISFAESIWTSPSVWNQMKVGEFGSTRNLELQNSNLPLDVQTHLLQTCQKSVIEAKEFSLKGRSNDYRIQQISVLQQIKERCSGAVGETFCIQESLEHYMTGCLRERLNEARANQILRAKQD